LLVCACYCPYENPLLIQINLTRQARRARDSIARVGWQPEQHSARFCDEEEAGADGLGADEHSA